MKGKFEGERRRDGFWLLSFEGKERNGVSLLGNRGLRDIGRGLQRGFWE